MRLNWLNPLLALVIALWAPMCCCQAALLAGAPIPTPCHASSGDDHAAETDADHCCCDADASDAATESDPVAPHDGLPCDSCPTCFGKPALGTTLDGGVRIDTDALAATLVVFIVAGLDGTLSPPATVIGPREHGPPHHTRANRAALRWHCALNV